MDNHDVTARIAAMNAGPEQRQQALSLVYEDLVHIARAELARHRRGETLNTRALVNETYLKLFDGDAGHFENRKHFFATAAKAMRQVVIDYARSRLADRRGAGAEHVALDALDNQPIAIDAQAEELVGMDKALEKLAQLDERLVSIVELRFFAGLPVKEIADLLGVSEPTVKRDTRAARAFLHKELQAHLAS
ncbi:ECF-type sigma factor [Tahibacter amnicola]|uniref:ECF-type sigma factor n=1 Tax=Tahibacter amnicola TaxID=2976241 RepID=A0ABY6BKQ5_9GAMM|nr:ECF-type sigma factor [Tahibacter amnicola]UXI68382.1 ECF-type sigma factor [Tahibacter amnicola]